MRKGVLPITPSLLLIPLALVTASAAAAENRSSLGIGAAWLPYYTGGDRYHWVPVPQAQLFNGLVRLQENRASLAIPLGDTLSLGPLLGWSSGRDEQDAELYGMGDLDASLLYGAFVRWQPGRFSATLQYLKASEDDQGASAQLTLGYQLMHNERQQLTFAVSGLWRDSDNIQSWYGVTPQQSVNSAGRYGVYSPASGVAEIAPQLRWRYQLSSSWAVNSAVGYSFLLDDARDSPLAEHSGSFQGLIGVNYVF